RHRPPERGQRRPSAERGGGLPVAVGRASAGGLHRPRHPLIGAFPGEEGRNTPTAPPRSAAARDPLRAFAPKLVDLTDNVLFGDVWERPGLSKRDRSLITCAALVALNRTEQQTGHFQRAINNGVKKEELLELITHLAFYGG